MRDWIHNRMPLVMLAIWWAIVPVFLGIWRLVLVCLPRHTAEQGMDQWLMSNFWSMGALLWIWLMIWALGSGIIWYFADYEQVESEVVHNPGTSYSRTEMVKKWQLANRPRMLIVCGLAAAFTIISFVQVLRLGISNDKDRARYYLNSVVYMTPSLKNAPDSLAHLTADAHPYQGKRCDLVGSADVFGCIKQGTLPFNGWEPRVGSLDGAIAALKLKSTDVQKVSLNPETVTYLNTWHGQPAHWSGLLDGSNLSQPMGGIASWSGTGTRVSVCKFEGPYALDRAFGGGRSNDLTDLLADRYPELRWKMSDVWGYCDGNQPIVIVPMTKQIYWRERTVDTAAGIVIITGHNGKTNLVLKTSVASGEYPGPVYPASLTALQRQQAVWAAGRQNYDRNGFGFEPIDDPVQAGNISEYLFRKKDSGRLVWVTPLALRGSTSQAVVAYAESYADQVNDGSLNRLSIYALAADDPRYGVNLGTLEANANTFLNSHASTILLNGGKLVEFTPIDGVMWRAFIEQKGGIVTYRLDISANVGVTPKLVDVTGLAGGEDLKACGTLSSSTDRALIESCMQAGLDQLKRLDGSTSSNNSK